MNPNHNRLALTSFLAAMLTLASFCVGVAPIPMTAFFCYPLAAISGITALSSGFIALGQIKATGQNGRWMALAGIGLGLLTIAGIICATTLTALLFYYGADYLKNFTPNFLPQT